MTDPTPAAEHTTPLDEIAAMRKAVNLLEPLDPAARARTVAWLAGRYGQGGKEEA